MVEDDFGYLVSDVARVAEGLQREHEWEGRTGSADLDASLDRIAELRGKIKAVIDAAQMSALGGDVPYERIVEALDDEEWPT